MLLAGCGHASIAGTYVGHRPIPRNDLASEGLKNTVSEVKLTIRDDDTFELVDAGLPKTGDVTYEGKLALLHVKKILGRAVEEEPSDVQARNQPIKLQILPKGKLEFDDPAGFDSKPLELDLKTN